VSTTEYATMSWTELRSMGQTRIDQIPVESRAEARLLLDALVMRAQGETPHGEFADVTDVAGVDQALEGFGLEQEHRSQIEPIFDALVSKTDGGGEPQPS
jgi:hypothetical protein